MSQPQNVPRGVVLDIEYWSPQGLMKETRTVPWAINMGRTIRKIKLEIEMMEGQKLLHVFEDERCLMRKYGIV